MTNKKLKRKIAVALSVAIATTMVTTAVPVEFGGMVAEAATAETIKITMKSEIVEITDEMRSGMYECAGEDNADSTLFTETNGQLIKLTLDLDTAESEMGAFGCSIGYNIEETIPIGFLRQNGNSYRTDAKYYKYDIIATQINNSRIDIEDEKGRKYVRVTGATPDLIYDMGSIAIFYFWIPDTSIGKVNFELYNYEFSGDNGEKIALEEGTSTTHFYDTGREAATVTFDANGGLFGEEKIIKKTVAKDSEIKIENPTFDGREFLGWSEDNKGESGIKKTVIAKDGVTYYAIWANPDLPSTVTASIEGIFEFDSTINAKSEGKPEDAGDASYQWYRANEQNDSAKVKIEGATGASYKITAEDVGKYLNVEVSYNGYRGSAKSAFTEKVQKAKKDAPVITVADCTPTANQITVKKIENAVYSIDGKNFTEDNVFTGLEPKTTYEISVKYKETDTHLASDATIISVTTTKAAPTVKDKITARCAYGTTLAAIKPAGEMVYNGKAVEGTFEWNEKNANEIYPKTGEKYKAIFRPNDTETYAESVEVEAEVSCEAKKITVKAISASAIYGEALPSFDFEMDENDLVGSDTKEDLALILQTNASQRPDAGEYTITKKECGNPNYDITVEPNVLIIEKAKPTIEITNTKEIQGNVTGAKAVITPESADAQAVIEYKTGNTDTWTEKIPTEVGTYTVRAYLPEEKAGKNLLAITSGNAITAEYRIEKKASSGNEGGNTKPGEDDNTGGNGGNTGGNTGGNGSSGIGGGSSSGGSVVTPPADNKPSKEDQNTDTPKKDEDTLIPPSDNTDEKDDTGKDNNTSSDNKQDNEKDNNKGNSTSKNKNKKPAKKKKVKLNKKKASVKVGKTIKLKVLNTKKKVTWSSNKPKIAKVNKKGKVTALKPGKAVIKAKIKNGKTLKFKITIKKVSKNKK
mgnify:CR=1 FL=1